MDERGDANREGELLRNIEEYQTKLAQLQEHQANLVDMQTRVRERLNEARQAQRMFLLQDNQNMTNSEGYQGSLPSNVERLETETAALRGKLAQLQSKKKRMDHLVAELQAIEQASEKSSSCVSFTFEKDAHKNFYMSCKLVYIELISFLSFV